MKAALLICLLVGGLLSACKEQLYSNLDEREANRIVAVLMRAGIDADRILLEKDTYGIAVEQTDIADVVEILDANGLPKETFARMNEVFDGDSFVLSKTEEHARYIFAISEELSKTLSDMSEISSAKVHIALPAASGFGSDSVFASASAFVRHQRDVDLARLVPKLKELIANSVEGLRYENISVITAPVQKPSAQLANAPRNSSETDRNQTIIYYLLLLAVVLAGFVLLLRRYGLTLVSAIRGGRGQKAETPPQPLQPVEIRRSAVEPEVATHE